MVTYLFLIQMYMTHVLTVHPPPQVGLAPWGDRWVRKESWWVVVLASPAFPGCSQVPSFWRVGPPWVQVMMVSTGLAEVTGRGSQVHSHQLSWGPRGASPRLRCSALCLASTFPLQGGEGEMEGSGFPFKFIEQGYEWGP